MFGCLEVKTRFSTYSSGLLRTPQNYALLNLFKITVAFNFPVSYFFYLDSGFSWEFRVLLAVLLREKLDI